MKPLNIINFLLFWKLEVKVTAVIAFHFMPVTNSDIKIVIHSASCKWQVLAISAGGRIPLEVLG